MNRQTEILFYEISRQYLQSFKCKYKQRIQSFDVSNYFIVLVIYLEKFKKNSWKDGNTLKYEWEISLKSEYFSLNLHWNSPIKNFVFLFEIVKYKRRISKSNERED